LVTLQSYGLAGSKTRISVREGAKVLATQEVTLKGDGVLQTESVVFNAGAAGPKSLEIAAEPASGEENKLNNKIARLVNVEAPKPRILYFDGKAAWEYKFVRRALDDYNDIGIFGMVRVTQNKILRESDQKDTKELEDGFPAKAEDLFKFQGLMIDNVEAS